MVSFNLITGFLGSGKTTLLINLLKELSAKYRIAVIQNEFAPTGIDGKELRLNADGFKLIEINNGSVFCVCQLNTFTQTMQKLVEDYAPEMVFLEASGLADPVSIVELLQTEQLKDKITLNKIISLVDAYNFHRGLNTLVRFKHQLMIADVLVLNKIDLFDGDLSDIEHEIEELNPFAKIVPTTYAQVAWKDLFSDENKHNQAALRFAGVQSEGRPSIKACVLRTHDKIEKEQLHNFIKELQKSCMRIKAYLNLKESGMVSVHSVFDQYKIVELKNYSGPAELIAFGENLEVRELRKTFKSYI